MKLTHMKVTGAAWGDNHVQIEYDRRNLADPSQAKIKMAVFQKKNGFVGGLFMVAKFFEEKT